MTSQNETQTECANRSTSDCTSTASESSDADSEPVRISNDAVVEDAFVDWQLNASNTPTISVVVDGTIDPNEFLPVDDDPENDPWLSENEYGLFMGWQKGLPVSEETGRGWTPDEIEHVDGSTDERYKCLHHVVASEQNDRDPDSVVSVTFSRGPKASPTTIPIRVGVLQEIVKKYINGPLGSDHVAYWYWNRSHPDGYGWHRGPSSKEDYDGYNDAEVVLVKDRNYVWRPKRAQDVTDDDVVYGEMEA